LSIKVFLLAGGKSERLWPLVHEHSPKHLLKLKQQRTILEEAICRFEKVSDSISLITSDACCDLVREHSRKAHVLVEPKANGTLAALCYGLKESKMHVNDKIILSPSDQYIADNSAFYEAIDEALMKNLDFILIGIEPTSHTSQFGYLDCDDNGRVNKFIEKPEKSVIESLQGKIYWNSGILIASYRAFIEALEEHAKPFAIYLRGGCSFEALPDVSIDRALLEKLSSLHALPMKTEWLDLGTWESLYSWLCKDGEENALFGTVNAYDTKKSLVIGGKRAISLLGVEELVVIDTEETLFIAKRGESRRIREVLSCKKPKKTESGNQKEGAITAAD